jgi:hypothetical protein
VLNLKRYYGINFPQMSHINHVMTYRLCHLYLLNLKSADDLRLPNTWSADGVPYFSAAHVHNLIQDTCTELFLDLKILLASQTLDENFKFHTELKYEEQKEILLSFVAVAGTSRFKMTSTTHGPFQASADGLGLPNTWASDGVRYSSAAQPDTRYTQSYY